MLRFEKLPGMPRSKRMRVSHVGDTEVHPGLYRIFWKDDGCVSLAAIGLMPDGDWWVAPTNWVKPAMPLRLDDVTNEGYVSWESIERLELVETYHANQS